MILVLPRLLTSLQGDIDRREIYKYMKLASKYFSHGLSSINAAGVCVITTIRDLHFTPVC